ncbi:MAG: M4 family metallopeptidase [Ferruginibacter sp.]
MKRCFFLTIYLLLAQLVFAQPSLNKLRSKMNISLQEQPANTARIKMITPVQASILFSRNQLKQINTMQWLSTQLGMRKDIDLLKENRIAAKTKNGLEVNSFQQYYKGIKVEHGMVNATSRKDDVFSMQLEFYSIPDQFATNPSVSEAAALQKAALSMQVADSFYKNNSKPAGELVIIRNYEDDSTVCLAWKFEIFNPVIPAMANVYVHAQNGKVVLQDNLMKHVNTNGIAATLYSGTQTIVTDNESGDAAKPYRLHQFRNGHNIITMNYEGRNFHPINTERAIEFTDNDNNWEAAEYNNAAKDIAALDVHFNMQIVSDYWKTVHGRNSWDNANSPLQSYVHVAETCETDLIAKPIDNAFWNKSAMYFGDGTAGLTGNCSGQKHHAFTSLDVTAHEVGHGITESTSRLIYRWQSGALNEAFSDIWATLIENWGIEQYPSMRNNKNIWLQAEEVTATAGKGFRDMKNPENFGDPSAFGDNNWLEDSEYPYCGPTKDNDYCGVHKNSGVINKWFYLITMGEAGKNTLDEPYNVTGIGFTKSGNLAYLTALNLTPNASFATAKAVSMNAAITLFGAGSMEVETVRSAWRAVGVDSAIWDMSNTQVFADNNTQSFTCIEIGKEDRIWAGTDKRGLYVYDRTVAEWVKMPEIPNVRINDLKNDADGGIWVAQSGTTNSGSSTGGGVNYFSDAALPMSAFYTVSTAIDVPTRNVRSLFIDASRAQDPTKPRIWVATNTYINSSGNSASGKPAVGLNASSPRFSPINAGIEISNGTGGVTAIGGNLRKVWTFAADNYNKSQILVYDAGTAALLKTYDNSTDPVIPLNINVKAIYTDINDRTWFSLGSNAVLVHDEHQKWHYVMIPSVFIEGSQANNNAIASGKAGDMYIGTTAGLVFFDHGDGSAEMIDNPYSYKLFKKQNGLPSSNITGIAYDYKYFKVWISTDQGICMWDPLCIGGNCQITKGWAVQTSSVSSGNWSDPAVWEGNIIPDSSRNVVIQHDIIVDKDAACRSLRVLPSASTQVNTGIKLTIYKEEEDGPISQQQLNK